MMRSCILGAAALAALASSGPAAADTVCEWMGFAGQIETASAPPPGAPRTPDHDRASTQVALAMFEALNAIDRRYESYLGLPLGDARASQDAAAISAAYGVLVAHYPGQKTALDENRTLALAGVRDSRAREAGRAIGEAAAAAALAAGGIDPAIAQVDYRPRTRAGEWVPTQLPVFEPFSIAFRPWILKRVDEIRPPAPPAMTSARWARDYDEVKRLGGRTSSERTEAQTLMARYRITPDMMPALRLAADAPGRRLVDNARLFALVEMASDDAGMATAEAKLHYNFWRPVTAIRNGEDDGNPATAPDPKWVPLINTPNHPEYPCGHCNYAGVVAEIMSAEVGPRPASGVRVSSYSLPNAAVQVIPSWDDWASEVSFSRTLGGVHYRFSNEAGEAIGRNVARKALASLMRPLPKARRRPAAG